ncbi:MAG: glycoside hydrolase family 13 protein [Ferruginibacter sp.]
MKKFCILLVTVCVTFSVQAQNVAPSIKRIDPTNWWAGMKNANLQLLVYGPDAGKLSYTINYAGVQLARVSKVENANYAFLDLVISPTAKAGKFNVIGTLGQQKIIRSYELKARTATPKGTGVSSADLIYLIMPDRFANGDVSNDKFSWMADSSADVSNPYLRHGGDFKGITNHLDYLQQLGVTALWLTPVIENDEAFKREAPDRMQSGYHGYHFTDHYQVDRRFGGNEGYVQFAKEVHAKGMKLIQDAVYNHISDDHWMFKDRPTKDWFNNWDEYTNSSHKEQPLMDPHSSAIDRKVLLDGWFTPFLPDLNQRNPFLANYLIQHAIWSTEMFSLDAWRIDTYKYNDEAFMNRCNKALLTEYPHIHLFGESVATTPFGVSYFVRNNVNFPFKSNLPGTLDFPLNYAINSAINQPFGWDDGVSKLYQTLAQDALYADPMKLVTSLDNHDMDRFLSVVGDNYNNYKLGVTWLLTTRGIPSWYYGTEILMKNFKDPNDEAVRRNFPGGFVDGQPDKFTAAGRNEKENDAFTYVSKLANYRKNTPALQSGKLMQYYPEAGVYVYFRYDANKTVMVISNTMEKEMTIKTGRFSERIKGFRHAKNIETNEMINDISSLIIPARTVWVLELGK